MKNGIILESVTKCFDGGVTAVDKVSLEIAAGEFMVLVGPSGCGKSTLLRLIAGLEDVTAGSITLGGREVTYLEPKDRDIAMVFQNYALYPHMTVEKNMAFSLTLRNVAKSEVKAKVDEAARVLGLDGLLKRKPSALSGGQRQRVAIGRAMVRDPQVFLMDEPLSNLDAKLRVQMRTELARLHAELRTTTVYVTHDQIEAMTLGDRVAVMRDGLIQQVDTPNVLFTEPANLFVAAFMGSPSMNLVQATISGRHAHFGSHRLPITDAQIAVRFDGRDVIIGIRPTSFDAAELVPDSSWSRLRAEVQLVENLGTEQHVIFAIDAPPVETGDTQAAADDGVSEANFVLAQTGRRAIWVARVGAGLSVRTGERISLAFDPNRLYLFDPQTGRSLRESHQDRPVEAQQVVAR